MLPEKFFSAVACLVGRALDAKANPRWLWNGRRVYMFDGTTVTMPDSSENQQAYPQVYNQKPGLGFPIARIGAITSLCCGAIVNLGFCRYAGKGQGEVSLLRRLWDVLRPGDVLLTDRLMANWTNILLLQERGVELVSRLNKANRKADFRRGKRLGNDDHIVRWLKPTSIRSLDWQTYKSLPEYITIREARIRVAQPGFRTKCIVVVTTLLDPQQTTKEDLATLYRARWNNELDLRTIKSTMQMHHLRCKTPELVHNEVWMHILGARKGSVTGTFVAFKDDRLLMLGKDLGGTFTKKYGNNVHFNKFAAGVPVYESIDGGDYKLIGVAEKSLANVKEGTIITVHSEGDDNITMVQIGAPNEK